ncbi:hypothetical protein [Acinetobacter chinensis]|uniref:hypothetical protein n=1 Tax=Acinetobacter chinensis TaxID=2004650 RepID=UPI002934461D|nr:hypothetical protein [Acinetobacter chinensis]WOE40104.1 hypothetical protein QSG87_09275 [Acinetobacter chinensis]
MQNLIEIKTDTGKETAPAKSLQADVYRALFRKPVKQNEFEFDVGNKTVFCLMYGFPWHVVPQDESFENQNGEVWGWNPLKVKGSGRFGGGWAFKFGITSNENFRELVIELGIGSIRLEIMNSRKGFRA